MLSRGARGADGLSTRWIVTYPLRRELDLRDRALRRVGDLEVLLDGEPEHAGEQVRRERHQGGVVVADVPVVEAPRERDLVLGGRQLLLQLVERLDGAQLRIGLGQRE